MKVIDVVPKLGRRRIAPATIEIIVVPLPLGDLGSGAHDARERGDLAVGAHGNLPALLRAQVQELPLDLRRSAGHPAREPLRREQLPIDEACMIDREEHSAEPARLQHLDVDPFGQERQLAAANETLLPRLREQRLSVKAPGLRRPRHQVLGPARIARRSRGLVVVE